MRIGWVMVLAGEVPGRTAWLEREAEMGRTVVGSAVPVPGWMDRGFVRSTKPLHRG